MNHNWEKPFAMIYTEQISSLLGSAAVQFTVIWWLTMQTESSIVLTLYNRMTNKRLGGTLMEIKLASELEYDVREEMSRIFAEGFGHWLTFFSKDTEVLSKAFAHMFLLDRFYVAVTGGKIAGITACTDGKSAPIRMDKRELKKHFGIYKGFLAGKILKPYLENHLYPFPLDEATGSIEYVGTAVDFRRQGVAAAIINHIIAHTDYRSYVLEVADTNENAVKLYEKLGFYEIHRTEEKHSKQSGVNFLVYMKYEKRVGIETMKEVLR